MWRKRIPCALLVGLKMCPATVKDSRDVPQKIKNRTLYDPVIALLGIYQKNTETLIQKDTCTCIFIAALFIISKL